MFTDPLSRFSYINFYSLTNDKYHFLVCILFLSLKSRIIPFMKKIIPLVLLLFIFNCKSTSKVISNTNSDTISAAEVKSLVSFLASDDLKGRDTGSDGINKAANFIEDKFQDFGIQPYFKTYRDEFQVDTLNAYNVVGYLEGNDPKLNPMVHLRPEFHHNQLPIAKMKTDILESHIQKLLPQINNQSETPLLWRATSGATNSRRNRPKSVAEWPRFSSCTRHCQHHPKTHKCAHLPMKD